MYSSKETSGVQIEALFKAYYRELCLFAFQFTEDMDGAEDIVQDVFMRCMIQNVNMEAISNPRAYLYTAVRNSSLRQVRKNIQVHRSNNLLSRPVETYENIERAIMEIERKTEIYRAIDSLPTQCRRIFVCCQIEKFKYRETAEELGISINSVKTQMKKAVRLLREALKDVYSHYITLLFFLISQ